MKKEGNYKVKRSKVVLFTFLVVLVLTACQQTPSTTIINNEELEISTETTEGVIDVDKLPLINLNTEDVDEVLECGDVSVTLKGTITKPNSYKDIYLYSVNVINYNEYENNMMFLFGEYESFAVRVRDKFIKVHIEDEFHAELTNTGLAEPTKITCKWGDIWFFRQKNPVTEDMRKVNMTNDEAKKQADEIMSRIGTKAFVYEGCRYNEEVLQITPDGKLSSPLGDSLEVNYIQKIQGIPLRTTLIESRIRPRAYVFFDSRGVSYVSISEYEYDVYSELKQCISYEEALQIFKNYISKDSLNDGSLYKGVEFQYTIDKVYINGEYIEMAIPYWCFDKEDHPDASWDPRGDIYINCIDGRVYTTDHTSDN